MLVDLEPYVCTTPNCSEADRLYTSCEEWFQHLKQHNTFYRCRNDDHPAFTNTDAFMKHLNESHGLLNSVVSTSPAIAQLYVRSIDPSTLLCPLCGSTSKNLRSHLGRHLERIALFALPRNSMNYNVEQALTHSSSSVAAARTQGSEHLLSLESSNKEYSNSSSEVDDLRLEDYPRLNPVPDAEAIDWSNVKPELGSLSEPHELQLSAYKTQQRLHLGLDLHTLILFRIACSRFKTRERQMYMRLLTWNSHNELSLTGPLHYDKIPPYAILSHTWGADGDEVTFDDLQHGRGKTKAGYGKIWFCGEQARKDKIKYFWVDTCCINKDNPAELSEAITSMYRWYRNAEKCYVYLSDVSTDQTSNNSNEQLMWQSSLRTSRWFTRGWTLQELLAPLVVEFFSREGELLGTKETLVQQIHEITAIPLTALRGTPLSQFSVAERIRWAERRQTTEEEDQAYCLLGIFNVFIPPIYGEGNNALRRLQKEIDKRYREDITAPLIDDYKTVSLGLHLTSAPLIEPNNFIGRTAEIDAIHEVLRPDEVSTEQRRVVLGGKGGIGKTQLAIAYARHHQRSYTSVLWLNATSESTLYATLRLVVQAFSTIEQLEELENQDVLARVHKWLSWPNNTRWLLIFDNYDEPDQFNINSFCPNTCHGSIIITTRLPEQITGQQVQVQPLQDINNGLAILQARSGRKQVQKGEYSDTTTSTTSCVILLVLTYNRCECSPLSTTTGRPSTSLSHGRRLPTEEYPNLSTVPRHLRTPLAG